MQLLLEHKWWGSQRTSCSLAALKQALLPPQMNLSVGWETAAGISPVHTSQIFGFEFVKMPARVRGLLGAFSSCGVN